ncbi:MAG: HAD-IIB family hydrolase [Thermoleophilia bacterium]|nr:HAD-IIB family hydrolase [Thermoleophilia bacterium]
MMGAAPPRAIYTDLDGTLLGKGGSLFRTAAGGFTLVGAEALELCHESRVELCFCSGRSLRLLREDARLMGVEKYIAEAGCVLVRDHGATVINNCQPYGEREGLSVFEEIAETGAPARLLERFGSALAYHEPWCFDHSYSHLMRGHIELAEASRFLKANGYTSLRLVDNGVIEDRGYGMPVDELHAYHIVPMHAGKGSAIRLDLEMSGISRQEAVACGDSAQDLEMAGEVRTLYLMANAAENHSGLKELLEEYQNVVVVEAPMVEGFSEAVSIALGI